MNAKVLAPELPDSLAWVNTRHPLKLEDLRGRVVLLHFWTYSNINSLHSLPDLRYLENKYHDGLTVLGIHTPKFGQERATVNVLKAVNRNHVRHPVANDPDFLAWQMYDVRAWPSFAAIDTAGNLVGIISGEGRRSELDALIGHLLDEAATQDARVFEPVQPAAKPEPKLPLRFPGQLHATESALFIADTGHNRVLEADHEGRILRQFGSGNPGFWDGRGTDTGFSEPQGLALVKDALFIADRGNHAIRRVRLLNGETDTVAGNGTQGIQIGSDLDPKATSLNSPWDLVASGDRVYIAMAGQHQVWMLDLARQRIGVYAGTGRMGTDDGMLDEASFAKPLGLATQGQMLYVADADASAIRSIKMLDGSVKTLVGAGLYEFGDTDGQDTGEIRLQHPIAVAADATGATLWIADSFNNKIKALSLRTGAIKTLELNYRLHEPSGLSIAAGSLWIANTNAHEIVRVDLTSGTARRVPIGE